MAFSSRRGRPRSTPSTIDRGTPELQRKRSQASTAEPLDQCLAKSLISDQQHWCGIHLRWLYTLRYGAPGASCRDISIKNHAMVREDDPAWREMREYEYHEAVTLLHREARYNDVMNLAVYHEIPLFLNARLLAQAKHSLRIAEQLNTALNRLKDGFNCLESLWCKAQKGSEISSKATKEEIFPAISFAQEHSSWRL